MEQYKLGEMEQKFADLIWANEPISTRELTRLCEETFCWKRTTTYTMLKRLCQRQLFCNDSGTVRALISSSDFKAAQGEQFLNDTFGGSLPQFLTAFTRRKPLSAKEVADIQRLIDEYKEE